MAHYKSVLKQRNSRGYINFASEAETLSEDEDDNAEGSSESNVCKEGPFSALTPSLCPQDVETYIEQPPEDDTGQVDYRYDEFGFKVEVEDGPEEHSSKLLSTSFVEDSSHRLKWIAYLEFYLNNEMRGLSWDQIDIHLPRSQKLFDMVSSQGIPHSLRAHIWPRLCGAINKRNKSDSTYQDIVKASSNEHLMTSKQIEKDLLRTLPKNACFCSSKSTGIGRLRRILRSIAWLYPDIGYCQGTGVIVATLLLFLEEEDTFWIACTIIEDLLPASYFSKTLIGVQADQRVLQHLISSFLPDVDAIFKKHDVEISLISLHWFLTIFSSVLHPRILLRVWDLFFYDGSVVLFQLTLGLLKMKQEELKALSNSAQIYTALSNIPSSVDDFDELLRKSYEVAESLSHTLIESHRRQHLAYLMADHGAILNPQLANNLPKQQLNKRHMKRSRSLLTSMLWGTEEDPYDGKAKNVQQTELLVDLREAILQIGKHFQSLDPVSKDTINLNADYSVESHSQDLDNYVKVAMCRRCRAKALVDFERHDNDELGFRKNDIITVLSTKDEHCWVGELRGVTGWFPAKFVELLDERSKQYSQAGDDSVSETITDLVRGVLCPALKALFEYGLKKSIVGGPTHPWLFIEEAALKEVEKDYHSVYARLVLCKAFKLDEDGKVLTPEEVLYRAVQSVNSTHDPAHSQMDVKLRSLICCGLNEQVLHLWLETLCSCQSVVSKWYHPWSYLRSPGWVQIKCDLRLLSQFAFHLNKDFEIAKQEKKWEAQFLSNVQEMLVKYHLFSWDMPTCT